jgi:serine/threonine-protein kinase
VGKKPARKRFLCEFVTSPAEATELRFCLLSMDRFPALEHPAASPHALGHYHLVAEIGRGGMADVYLALAPSMEGGSSQVVVKQLRSDVLDDEDFRVMFFDEARLAKKLDHPNVVKTYDVGKDGESCFLVMEFLDGQPLSRIRRHARRTGVVAPLAVHLRIFGEVLAALHYVHELADQDGVPLGVVHRDVTPQNVFVTYGGRVKVLDFGIAKARARQAGETRVGVVKGKLSYMAPENVRGDQVDRRSDVFSVGVMLFEAATGKRFWQGLDELAIYQKLISGELPVEAGRADMSPQLFAIVEHALASDPESRYATAAEMQRALEALSEPRSAPADVASYLDQLFVDERRRFHERVEEEVRRLEAGEFPAELPNLRNDGLPLSGPAEDRNDFRNAATVRPGNVVPNSVRTNPTVKTSFTSPSTMIAPPAGPSRLKLSLYAGAGAMLTVLAFLVMRGAPSKIEPAAQPAATQATTPATIAPRETPALAAPMADPPPSSTIDLDSPLEIKHLHPATPFVRPAAKKTTEPPDLPELVHVRRTKRQLDADDPWGK